MSRKPLLAIVIVLGLCLTHGSSAVRINEFVAVNSTGVEDKDDDRPDWLELYHDGEEILSLAGWHLTDDEDDLRKWSFPNRIRLLPDSHTVVFASSKNDNSLFSRDIHTNFSLSGDGGYLALVRPDGSIAHEIADYPQQRRDIAYGFVEDAGEELDFLLEPSPGEGNTARDGGAVGEVQFSVTRGLFNAPFLLELSTSTEGAQILFSTNGRVPSLFTASFYREPIEITKTTIVRALASKTDLRSSSVETHTYIFPEDVISQEKMKESITGDADVRKPLLEGLASIDSVSIARHTTRAQISSGLPEAVSIELITRNEGEEGFQIDAGIKRVGGASVNHPKNNMRLYFSSEYGQNKLKYPLYKNHPYTSEAAETFDRLQLHGGSHDSVFYQPTQALYLRNRWMNDSQFAMGQPSLRGRWVHVYLQGEYWGLYELIERPHPSYFASYLGGEDEDYLATNHGIAVGSDSIKPWKDMIASVSDYGEFKTRADVNSLVDYMLLNLYAANQDWNPQHNWMGGGPIRPDKGGFKFFSWDSDLTLRNAQVNLMSSSGPDNLFRLAKRQPDFKRLLADRAYKHFSNDGALTRDRCIARLEYRASQIDQSIHAESARWGVGNWRHGTWTRELDRVTNSILKKRTKIFLDQLKNADLFNDRGIPSLSPMPGPVSKGEALTLRKSLFVNAEIYYTTNGSDPRAPGGDVSQSAFLYKEPIPLTDSLNIRVRTLTPAGIWSVPVDGEFLVGGVLASPDNVVISKINYRPGKPSEDEANLAYTRGDFEFIELHNPTHETVFLRDVAFTRGIRFRFDEQRTLPPGATIMLVRSPEAFQFRHGNDLPIAGNFTGSLANDGETIRLEGPQGLLVELAYDDNAPWPEDADGQGAYLVRESNADLGWRSSNAEDQIGGSPALPWSPTDAVIDSDLDGAVDLLEIATGTDPFASDSTPQLLFRHSAATTTYQFTQSRDLGNALTLSLEFSLDLETWEADENLKELNPLPNPVSKTLIRTFQTDRSNDRQRFVRLRVAP